MGVAVKKLNQIRILNKTLKIKCDIPVCKLFNYTLKNIEKRIKNNEIDFFISDCFISKIGSRTHIGNSVIYFTVVNK
jgi:hypothetical protein